MASISCCSLCFTSFRFTKHRQNKNYIYTYVVIVSTFKNTSTFHFNCKNDILSLRNDFLFYLGISMFVLYNLICINQLWQSNEYNIIRFLK